MLAIKKSESKAQESVQKPGLISGATAYATEHPFKAAAIATVGVAATICSAITLRALYHSAFHNFYVPPTPTPSVFYGWDNCGEKIIEMKLEGQCLGSFFEHFGRSIKHSVATLLGRDTSHLYSDWTKNCWMNGFYSYTEY